MPAVKPLETEYIIGPNYGYVGVHGSSGVDPESGFNRIFPVVKADTWLVGDINQNLLDAEVRKFLHIYLAEKKLKISEEGINELVEQCVIMFKMRVGAFYNPQLKKINLPDSFIKELNAFITKVKSLPKDAPIALIKFKEDPLKMKRMDLKKLLKLDPKGPSVPGFGFYEGDVFYVTANGQISKVQSLDTQKCHFLISLKHPKELLADEEKQEIFKNKITYAYHNDSVYLVRNQQIAELKTAGPESKKEGEILPDLFTSTEPTLGTPAQVKQMESLLSGPALENTQGLRNVFAGLQENVVMQATTAHLAAIKKTSGYEAHEDCIPLAYVEKLEQLETINIAFKAAIKNLSKKGLPKNVDNISKLLREEFPEIINYYDVAASHAHDHIILSRFDEKNNNVLMTMNSMEHEALRKDQFKFDFDPEDPKDSLLAQQAELMNDALAGLVMRESIKVMLKRAPIDGFNVQIPENLGALLNDNIRVDLFENISPADREKMGVPADLRDSVFSPVNMPAHFDALLELYQKLIKNSTIDSTVSDNILRAYFETIYKSPEFNRINNLLKVPFENPLAKLDTLLSPENIKKEFRIRWDKAQNLIFGKQELKVAKPGERTLSISTPGFSPLKDPKTGAVLKLDQLLGMQLEHILTHIYRQHLLHPQSTISLVSIELGDQEMKKALLSQFINTINTFVMSGEEASPAQRETYYSVMREWGETLNVYSLAKNEAERECFRNVQSIIRVNGISVLNSGDFGVETEYKAETAPAVMAQADAPEEGPPALRIHAPATSPRQQRSIFQEVPPNPAAANQSNQEATPNL